MSTTATYQFRTGRFADRFLHQNSNGTFDDYTDSVVTLRNVIVEGIKGTIEAYKILSRPGITFTPEQEAQIRSLVETGKTQDAQNIILDELGKEFPDGTR